MSSARLNQRRRRKLTTCLTSFDQTLSKSLKVVSYDISSDRTALSLLDLVAKCEKKWIRLLNKLNCKLKLSVAEISRLRSVYVRTQEMLEMESSQRRRAERVRDQLRRKIDVIKEILTNNDVDEARRRLETIDKSMCSNDRSIHEVKFDHSAGSLLDPANVSGESLVTEKKRISNYRRAGSAENSTQHTQFLRRSARLSKFRSSSVPKIIASNNNAVNGLMNGLEKKHAGDESDDSYVGMEIDEDLLMKPNRLPPFMKENSGKNAGIIKHRQVNLQDTPSSVHNRLNKPHNFISRPVLRMEMCSFCGRRFTFGKSAFRCQACHVIVHPACREHLIQSCIPLSVSRTPLSSFNKRTPVSSPKMTPAMSHSKRAKEDVHATTSSPALVNGRLATRNIDLWELCPEDQYPRIPALVIHCVTEVLARGLHTIGLYRVSGSEKQVRDLFDKFFTGKSTPVLARIEDIHVVCGCLKLFLRSLSEPLITYALRPTLTAISSRTHLAPDQLVQHAVDALDTLPTPNRDTLSYLMLHLKTVASSSACQMGEENLCKVFGPTLIGYSCPEPQPMQTVTETSTQQAVMRLLFSVPDYVYSSFVNVEPNNHNDAHQDTYFSPVLAHDQTSKTPLRTPGMSSARKRFFPYFTSHHD